jgi:hypothetical protein
LQPYNWPQESHALKYCQNRLKTTTHFFGKNRHLDQSMSDDGLGQKPDEAPALQKFSRF